MRVISVSVLALLAASLALPAGAAEDGSKLVTQRWSCVVVSELRGDLSFRTYLGGNFDARFIFDLSSADGNTVTGTVVAEKWRSGSQNLLEFRVSGRRMVNNGGHASVFIERMGITRSSGNLKDWPKFNQSMLSVGNNGSVYAQVDVGEWGDIASGSCTQYYG